ncbi:MAG TPA: hypothetical protein VG795_07060, partial [Acidimicrobiia bacterium]|nr:hypothetical protein [Acidimicrobiia bacterium]
GLNNSEVAHHGLSKAIIDRASPDLLLIHWVAGNPMGPWQVMAETARNWAVAQNYVLAASYGPPDDTHLYFVRPGPDEVRLSAAVRVTPYDRSGP